MTLRNRRAYFVENMRRTFSGEKDIARVYHVCSLLSWRFIELEGYVVCGPPLFQLFRQARNSLPPK